VRALKRTMGKEIKIDFYRSLDKSDANAAFNQVSTGLMSGYVGAWGDQFFGGPEVIEFEKRSKQLFGFDYAISVNSWTSGLEMMVGSIGNDDDSAEIIVTPWTMSATVMTIIKNGAIPVFADIDPLTFMPSLDHIKQKITSKTKAIMLADIFGQAYPYDDLIEFKKKGIKLISDAAQAPLATRHGKHAGFEADITGISLNRHKHINTGEGGIILTNDEHLAKYCFLSRNHGENITNEEWLLPNMIGNNFRLTETQAAIGKNQLLKLKDLVLKKRSIASTLINELDKSEYFYCPPTIDGNIHSYYIFPILIRDEYCNPSFRKKVNDYVISKGLPSLLMGYQNIHRLPLFTNPDASTGKFKRYFNPVSLPNAEKLHDQQFIGILFCNHDFTEEDVILIAKTMEDGARS
jgi:perosamine synthetase